MASPRDIRKLALLAMYQLDATKGEDPESVRDALDDVETLEDEGLSFVDQRDEFTSGEREKAFRLAMNAFKQRDAADAVLGELSTEWSVSRMPVVDRSILRLAYYEMTRVDGSEPKGVVNEAVELAKQFSTEHSPGFVNAILDKILKRVLAASRSASETGGGV
ncbi:MAG: transcription antitermination factor NusB [Phycisphaerales bacterium]|nr:transcription antitermination factor NusB [Phycisphaerales bacterium]